MVTLLDLFRKLEKMVPGDKSLGYLIRGDRKCPHAHRKKNILFVHFCHPAQKCDFGLDGRWYTKFPNGESPRGERESKHK